jgi:hypothetical protein
VPLDTCAQSPAFEDRASESLTLFLRAKLHPDELGLADARGVRERGAGPPPMTSNDVFVVAIESIGGAHNVWPNPQLACYRAGSFLAGLRMRERLGVESVDLNDLALGVRPAHVRRVLWPRNLHAGQDSSPDAVVGASCLFRDHLCLVLEALG